MRAAPVIRENGGFIDKFIGDGIMALFPGDPADAVRAANGLHASVRLLNEELAAEGRAPIAIGVGLNTGLSDAWDHRLCRADGDHGRLRRSEPGGPRRGMTKQYGAKVVITGETLAGTTPDERAAFAIRRLDRVQVVGKSAPLDAYEVFDAEPEPLRSLKLATLSRYEEAFQRWVAGDFEAARSLFSEAVAQNPEDRAAQLHLARCLRFLKDGVPPGWNGVMPLDQK